MAKNKKKDGVPTWAVVGIPLTIAAVAAVSTNLEEVKNLVGLDDGKTETAKPAAKKLDTLTLELDSAAIANPDSVQIPVNQKTK